MTFLIWGKIIGQPVAEVEADSIEDITLLNEDFEIKEVEVTEVHDTINLVG